MSSGSRLSSHFWSRSASPFSGAKSTVLALSMTLSSTKIGARARSASAMASLGLASIASGSPFDLQVDERVEGVLLQVGDHDLLDVGLEIRG